MRKACFRTAIVLGILCLAAAGCYIEIDPNNVTAADAWGDGTFSDTVEGTSKNGYYGAMYPITVTLEIELGIIKSIEVAHRETAEHGGKIISMAKPLIVKANSFDVLDGMTGATFTRKGLKEAGKAALNKIPGVEL